MLIVKSYRGSMQISGEDLLFLYSLGIPRPKKEPLRMTITPDKDGTYHILWEYPHA